MLHGPIAVEVHGQSYQAVLPGGGRFVVTGMSVGDPVGFYIDTEVPQEEWEPIWINLVLRGTRRPPQQSRWRTVGEAHISNLRFYVLVSR